MTGATKLRDYLEREAKALGFDAVGITSPTANPDLPQRLASFVNSGHHGTMQWMEDTLERRAAPLNLWPDVRSIIMLAVNYGPHENPLPLLNEAERGVISVYARHRDYHDVIKGRLKTLASKLLSRAGDEHQVKVFVDTAPFMEKPFAQSAGLGWQGKHTNLVSREFGSWLFLGSIFTTMELTVDTPEVDHCGSCQSCLDICPTNAFPAPYQLDARRCISYLTIEHKGPIPEEFRKPMGNRIYGCDDCLAVCPWNKFAQATREVKLQTPEPEPTHHLWDFLGLDDQTFRRRFSGSPVKRIGRNRFIRNCLIAAGNSGDPALRPIAEKLVSDADPVVSEAALWAINQLAEKAE